MSWRVGKSCGVHVYEDDRPVAMFHTVEDAAAAVEAVNLRGNQTLVPISPEIIGEVAQAIRNSNGSQAARDAWGWHPQLVPADVYAQAAVASLLAQGYVLSKAPPGFRGQSHCPTHHAIQHRDMREPWCTKCGLTEDFREPQSHRNRRTSDLDRQIADDPDPRDHGRHP